MTEWGRKSSDMKRTKAALITGFEPFGGYEYNPSGEIARRLDGHTIDGVPVVGRVLPVDMTALDGALSDALRGLDPVAVLLLGLAPGEAVIRLERVALNLADFAIADNAGAHLSDRPLDDDGGAGLWSRLPLRAIQAKLLAAGIPARLSETAGTYLCNAALYRTLQRLPRRVPCGFIHLPLLPAEVAQGLERDSGGPILPSMAFPFQRRAVEIALAATLAETSRMRRTKA
jgi:pyroglutamyl-peptidase